MNRTIFIGIVVLSLGSPVIAQQLEVNPAPQDVLINDVAELKFARNQVIPYLNDDCVAVVEIDVTKIDLLSTIRWFQKHLGWAANRFNPVGDDARAFVEAFEQMSPHDFDGPTVVPVYVCGSLESLLRCDPLLVIPHGYRNLSDLVRLAPKSMSHRFSYDLPLAPLNGHFDMHALLFGSQKALDQPLRPSLTRWPKGRRDLVAPLFDQNRLDHVAVLSLTPEAKIELAAFWPDQLPSTSPIQFSPKQLVADINRVSITFDLPKQPAANANPSERAYRTDILVKIEAANAQACQRVRRTIVMLMSVDDDRDSFVNLTTTSSQLSFTISWEQLATVAHNLVAPARANENENNVRHSAKQIGLAIHNYHATHGHLPPRCFTDRRGTPLLSWRVAILPFLDQSTLYEEIRLGEAWNSVANSKYANTFVPTYSAGMEGSDHPGATRFRAPVFPGSIWNGEGPPKRLRDVTDGTSNTIALIHAPPREVVDWMAPNSWIISEEDPVGDIFGDEDQITVVMLDGAVRVISRDEVDNEKLTALLTFAGNEKVEW